MQNRNLKHCRTHRISCTPLCTKK